MIKELTKKVNRSLDSSTDVLFVTAMAAQALGVAAFTALYLFNHASLPYTVGLFNAGTLLSCIVAPFFKLHIRKYMMITVIAGSAVQALILAGIPYGQYIFMAGLAIVLTVSATILATDALRNKYIEGWLFSFAYPAVVVMNFMPQISDKLNVLMSGLVTMLFVLLLKKRITILFMSLSATGDIKEDSADIEVDQDSDNP